MRHNLFAIILFICTSVYTYGQWRGAVLENPGLSAGFDAEVRDIAQDSTGYLYFATDHGLYQYDGSVFRYFGHDPGDPESIPPGQIFKMCVSHDNIVWLTLFQSGLVSYDPVADHFQRYALPDANGTKFPGAISLCEDLDSSSIWVGLHFGYVARFDRQTKLFELFHCDLPVTVPGSDRIDINRIVQDQFDRDRLWLSMYGDSPEETPFDHTGIFSFNKSTTTFTAHPCSGNIDYQDADGALWSTIWHSSITRYAPDNRQCEVFPFTRIVDRPPVARDILRYGETFIVAANFVLKYAPGRGFSPLTSLANSIGAISLFTDNVDNLWIGTLQGVRVMDPDNQHIEFFSLDTFDVLTRLFPARLAYHHGTGTIFLAQTNAAPSERIFAIPIVPAGAPAYQIPTGFTVHGMATDTKGRVWVAGRAGFFHLDPNGHRLTKAGAVNPPGDTLPWLWNIRAHTNGWIGALGDSLFYWFHVDDREISSVSILDIDGVQTLRTFGDFSFSQNDEAVLVAKNHVYLLSLTTGKVKRAEWPDEIADQMDLVHCAQRGPDGKLWVLTFTTLFVFEEKAGSLRLIESYTLKDGLASPTMQEFHRDAYGRIWVFSSRGINAIDPDTRQIRYYGTREGLPISFIDPRQVVDLPGGRIATVCSNGLIVFDANKLWHSKDARDVHVVVVEVRVNGVAFSSEDATAENKVFRLPKGSRTVDVQFQGLVFPDDMNSTYSYRLAELNPEWVDIGANKLLTLPSLPYGTTTLEIKAASPVSQAPVTQVLLVLPIPIHAQLWFWPVIGLLILAAIYVFYRLRVRQIRRLEEEKTRINKQFSELELKALRSQMNPHFMFNSLNSIKTYILEARPDIAADYLSQFAHLIRRILQNSREQLIPLKEETETLRLYISLEQFRFENAFEVEYEFAQHLDLEDIMVPPMLLQPYIENAIWHGLRNKGKDGLLKLQLRQNNGSVKCTIEDNGVGRAKAQELKSLSATRHKSMGMGITQSRIDLMASTAQYQISVQVIDKTDTQGNALGTIVEIDIPLSMDTEGE